MFEVVCIILAIIVTVTIGFPQIWFFLCKHKKTFVGSTYWGAYEGSACEDLEGEEKVELPEPARKEQTVAGFTAYSGGRAISFRQ
jgi:hypothetical protein